MLKLSLKIFNPFEQLHEKRLASAVSLRSQGNMSLSYGDTGLSLAHRKDFLAGLGIDYKNLVCAKQVHGNNVRQVSAKERGRGALDYAAAVADTDGFITDVPGLPLAIFTADCLSVFLYDPSRPAIGLVHAGWRSSRARIVSAAIKLMQDKFGTNPAGLFAGFGPAIKNCCYEVSAEFREYFPLHLTERAGRLYLDLCAANKEELLKAGLLEKNIFDQAFCTSCVNEEFFSFRKEGETSGRMLSVMMLR